MSGQAIPESEPNGKEVRKGIGSVGETGLKGLWSTREGIGSGAVRYRTTKSWTGMEKGTLATHAFKGNSL